MDKNNSPTGGFIMVLAKPKFEDSHGGIPIVDNFPTSVNLGTNNAGNFDISKLGNSVLEVSEPESFSQLHPSKLER